MRHLASRCAFAALLVLGGCAGLDIDERRQRPPASPAPWAELSVRPSLARPVTETILQVGDLPFGMAGEESDQWLRKTTKFFGGATRVQWTDTRACPAARAVLSSMYALEVPRPAPGGTIAVRSDSIRYALSTDARFGSEGMARLSISASGGTPLADWAERSLAQLEPCWSDLPPPHLRQAPPAGRR